MWKEKSHNLWILILLAVHLCIRVRPHFIVGNLSFIPQRFAEICFYRLLLLRVFFCLLVMKLLVSWFRLSALGIGMTDLASSSPGVLLTEPSPNHKVGCTGAPPGLGAFSSVSVAPFSAVSMTDGGGKEVCGVSKYHGLLSSYQNGRCSAGTISSRPRTSKCQQNHRSRNSLCNSQRTSCFIEGFFSHFTLSTELDFGSAALDPMGSSCMLLSKFGCCWLRSKAHLRRARLRGLLPLFCSSFLLHSDV